MRLQQTVNSPTQPRIILLKQGGDEGTIKLISPHLKRQLIWLYPDFHPFLLFSLPPPFCPVPPFLAFFLSYFPESTLFFFLIHLSFPSSPPIHSCCLGNNTKRFSSQLCHRGNAWLSSRPLLEARRFPVHSRRLVLTAVGKRPSIGWKWLKCWTNVARLWLWNCSILHLKHLKPISNGDWTVMIKD